MVAQKLEHTTVNKPHALFLGELSVGLMLDLVVCLFSYLTADRNHNKMGMEMFQVTFNP